jgi:hypothetical protein
MDVKLTAKYVSLTFSALLASTVFAEEVFDIPVMDDAIIFASFNDKAPAVINYYTSMTVKEVINFYKVTYGKILYHERKRGRLTLSFYPDDLAIRVIISKQNNKRQVDVIVDNFNSQTMTIPEYKDPFDGNSLYPEDETIDEKPMNNAIDKKGVSKAPSHKVIEEIIYDDSSKDITVEYLKTTMTEGEIKTSKK